MHNVPTHVKKFMELHGYVFRGGKFEKQDDLAKIDEMFGGIFSKFCKPEDDNGRK